MTVRVLDLSVNEVSFIRNTRDESILFSMSEQLGHRVEKHIDRRLPHRVLHSPDALRTAWYEHRVATKEARIFPYVSCVDWPALVIFCSASYIIMACFMIYIRATGWPTHCLAANHSIRVASHIVRLHGSGPWRLPTIGTPICWSFTFFEQRT